MVFPIKSKKENFCKKKMKLKINTTEKTAVLETPKHNVSSLEGVHWNFKVGPWNIIMGSEINI